MRIIYIHKDLIQRRPPDISAVLILRELGYDVSLVTCGANEEVRKMLADRGVALHVLDGCAEATSRLGKVMQYWRFARGVKATVSCYPADSVLWLEGASTLRSLGPAFLRGRSYILQIQELWESCPKLFRSIGKVIGGAKVVFMPEYSRTSLYQVWFGLKQRPTVLPNKPYFIPSAAELEALKAKYPQYVELFEDKKVILYQGHISKERDLSAYVKAVRELGDGYRFVMMGTDHGIFRHYREIDPNVVHIDFIPAPDYLLMTSMAHIGILGYSPICENNIFCAPNKIYEYSAFGLPILGNDIPGLYYLINQHRAGRVTSDTDAAEIKAALLDIERNYGTFSEGAKALFAAADNKETIRAALAQKGI